MNARTCDHRYKLLDNQIVYIINFNWIDVVSAAPPRQVTRAALQTFVIMFAFLGKSIEAAKSLDDTLQLLLTKTTDTNRQLISFDYFTLYTIYV
jgi:hypothetical protein